MCRAFSCLVDRGAKVTWKFGVDSHTTLVEQAGYKDTTLDPNLMTFARVEITPKNNSYFTPDEWILKVDEAIKPNWFGKVHEVACFSAHKQWEAKLRKILVNKSIVHPFELSPTVKITNEHIQLLKQWDSVRDSVWASVGASVRDSVVDSVWASVWDSVGASVRDSVWASVGASVGDSVVDSVGASVRDSVVDSVGASVWAYIGSFFVLQKWQGVKHKKGEYPFAPCVKLWESGLVPSFDGTTWRLHGGKDAEVLFQISKEELAKR